MNRALEGITIGGYLVVFWAWVFALWIDSPILETMFEWLLLYIGLVLLLLLDRAFQYFEAKREQRLNEKEQ